MRFRISAIALLLAGLASGQNAVLRYNAASPTVGGACTGTSPVVSIGGGLFGVYACIAGTWTQQYPTLDSTFIRSTGSYNNPPWLTGINANIIGAQNISNTEFGYLDGLTANIQQQINNVNAGGGGTTTTDASQLVTGTLAAARLPAFTGDVTSATGTGVLTLPNVVTAGTVGSSTAVPILTFDNKGRITGTSTASISVTLPTTTSLLKGNGTGGATAGTVNIDYAPGTFTQLGIGAVARTVIAKLGERVSVLDFGADPTGVADTTNAIQSAFTAAALAGRPAFIPAGTYKVTAPLEVTGNVIADPAATLKAGPSQISAVINIGSSSVVDHGYWYGGKIDGNGTALDGIFARQISHYEFSHLTVWNTQANMIHLGDPTISGGVCYEGTIDALSTWRNTGIIQPSSAGVFMDSCTDNVVLNSLIVDAYYGVWAKTSDNKIGFTHVWGHPSQGNMSIGFYDQGGRNTWWADYIDTVNLYGMQIDGFNSIVSGTTFFNNFTYGSDNVAIGVHFTQAAPNTYLSGNQFVGQNGTHRWKQDYDVASSTITGFGNLQSNVATVQPGLLLSNSIIGTQGFYFGSFSGSLMRNLSGSVQLANNTLTTPVDFIWGANTATGGIRWHTAGNEEQLLAADSSGPAGLVTKYLTLGNAGATQPGCVVGVRGMLWHVQAASGATDFDQVCAKNNSDTYNWLTLNTVAAATVYNQTIQNNGTPVTQRAKVNFIPGTNTTFSFADNGTDTTSITINSAAGGGSMVYPPAGIGVSTGSAWGSSITPATGISTFLATPSSANLAAAMTDETGSGANVFATSPTLTTPTLTSPALTGTPTVPTAAPGTNTTQAASTAFVTAAVAAGGGGGGGATTPATSAPICGAGSANSTVACTSTALSSAIGTGVYDASGVAAAFAAALNASNLTSGIIPGGRMPALGGDVTSSAGSTTTNLATVNSSPGTFGSSTAIPVLTLDGKGRVLSVSTTTVSGGSCSAGGATTVASTETVGFSATPTFSAATRSSLITLTGNITSFTLAAGADGQEKTLAFCENATGGFTVTAPLNVRGFTGMGGAVPSKCMAQHFTYFSALSSWLSDAPGVMGQ
jgi:hypothetical protein